MRKKLRFLVVGLMFLVLSGCSTPKPADGGAGGYAPTLIWYAPGDEQPDMRLVMEEANKIILPKLGVKLDLQMLDSGAYSDKMTMNMASRASFDICFTGYINNYQQAVEHGGLLQLDELLEKQATALYNEIDKKIWDCVKIDGKIYGVPNQQTYAAPAGLFVDKIYAEKYGFNADEIKELDDIEPFLQRVKAGEPSVYPFEASSMANLYRLNQFININDIIVYRDSDTSYTPLLKNQLPELKDAATKLYDWYKKGYIRKDVLSAGDVSKDIKAGKYAVLNGICKFGAESEFKNNTGRDFIMIPMNPGTSRINGVENAMTGISKTTKYPEKALKLIELINTDKELYNLICFGVKDKHYNVLSNGKIELNQTGGYLQNASWKFGNQFNALIMDGQSDDVWIKTKEQNDNAPISPFYGFKLDTKNISVELSQYDAILGNYTVINFGAENPDTYWNEMQDRMQKAGSEKILNEVKKQINEFLNK